MHMYVLYAHTTRTDELTYMDNPLGYTKRSHGLGGSVTRRRFIIYKMSKLDTWTMNGQTTDVGETFLTKMIFYI